MTYVAVAAVAIVLAVALWIFARRRKPVAPPPVPAPRPTFASGPDAYAVDPTADEDRLHPRPRAPVQSPDACWVPPGRAVTVRGFTIPRGMVYVGAGLYKDRVAWKPEDCLVDPTLDVSADNPDVVGRTVPYWPAYGKLNPSARAAFLAFLAAGAEDPAVHPGYVMLYFYGLERRLLKDRLPTGEAETLLEEVRRLQARYGHHPFFDAAARRLFATLEERRREGARGAGGQEVGER